MSFRAWRHRCCFILFVWGNLRMCCSTGERLLPFSIKYRELQKEKFESSKFSISQLWKVIAEAFFHLKLYSKSLCSQLQYTHLTKEQIEKAYKIMILDRDSSHHWGAAALLFRYYLIDSASFINLIDLELSNRTILKLFIRNLEIKIYRRVTITKNQIIIPITMPIKKTSLLVIFYLSAADYKPVP